MSAMLRPRRLALLLLSAFALACSDEPSGPDADSIDGLYELARIVDRDVPTPIYDGTFVDDDGGEHDLLIRANSGVLRLTDGGTRYIHHVDLSSWVDGSAAVVSDVNDFGFCTRTGATLACESNWMQNVAFTAVVDGDQVTIVQDLSGEAAPVPHTYRR